MALSINNLISSSSIFGSSSSSSSSIFGTSSSSSSNILGDYASIKNGSYKKLLKAYYTEQSDSSSELTETESKQTSLMSSNASDLKAAADAFKSNALFEEGEDGYDYDALFEAAEKLVEAYNSVVDSTNSISITAADKKMSYASDMLSKNAGLLEEAGISIEEGKLTIDEDKFKSADISTIKTLFQGSNSIAAKLSSKASDIYNIAQTVLGKKTGTYTGRGSASTSSSAGSLLNAEL